MTFQHRYSINLVCSCILLPAFQWTQLQIQILYGCRLVRLTQFHLFTKLAWLRPQLPCVHFVSWLLFSLSLEFGGISSWSATHFPFSLCCGRAIYFFLLLFLVVGSWKREETNTCDQFAVLNQKTLSCFHNVTATIKQTSTLQTIKNVKNKFVFLKEQFWLQLRKKSDLREFEVFLEKQKDT